MLPVIGIIAAVDAEFNTNMQSSYILAIEHAGGCPIVLPYVQNQETVELFISLCDGFLFAGGKDVDPTRYGEEISPNCGEIHKNRDALEFLVFEKAYQAQKPILGICRGAQVINIALGGTLYQDVSAEMESKIAHRQVEPKNAYSHSVRILKSSPLRDLIGGEKMRANSFHHQAIKTLGDNLKAMAWADDGIIEAIYATGERYIRGYQWHPERLADEYNQAIFTDFILSCKHLKKV